MGALAARRGARELRRRDVSRLAVPHLRRRFWSERSEIIAMSADHRTLATRAHAPRPNLAIRDRQRHRAHAPATEIGNWLRRLSLDLAGSWHSAGVLSGDGNECFLLLRAAAPSEGLSPSRLPKQREKPHGGPGWSASRFPMPISRYAGRDVLSARERLEVPPPMKTPIGQTLVLGCIQIMQCPAAGARSKVGLVNHLFASEH
jgi:hypothetical protein